MLKDSGNRREFETGAVRDMNEGKGRCDLLPACALLKLNKYRGLEPFRLSVSIRYLIDDAIVQLLKYLDGDDNNNLCAAASHVMDAMKLEEKKYIDHEAFPACAIIRLSKHYEEGAKKYSDRNWEKGLPISCMIDSGMRHLLKYLDGWTDEDHLCAAFWNILGAIWMEEKHPELQDIPARNESQGEGVLNEP